MSSPGRMNPCALAAALLLIAASSASAEIVECPDGTTYVVDDPLDAPCVELCPGTDLWRVVGVDEECPEAASRAQQQPRGESTDDDLVDSSEMVTTFVLMLFGVAVYLFPSIVAGAREHH